MQMRLFTSLEEIDKIEETVVALGNFDGVHKGHQELIRRTVNSAIGANLKSAVFTFSNHCLYSIIHYQNKRARKKSFLCNLGIPDLTGNLSIIRSCLKA
jgi:FAD synthase